MNKMGGVNGSGVAATCYGLDRVAALVEAPGSESAVSPDVADLIRGRRCGLVANHTGLGSRGKTTLAILTEFGADVRALFSPEHGFAGTSEGYVESSTQSQRVCHSLYGASRRPTSAMLHGLDTLVFDIQDVGARFYTYSTTLCYTLEACAESGVSVVVLDRPNPLGGSVIEGPIVEEGERSFVGYARVPIRHGFTLGELARWHVRDHSLELGLAIVPVGGWSRTTLWPETGLTWRPPSPNLPNFSAAEWYPGTCLLEFSDLSVGRGTDFPFALVGAHWLDPQLLLDDSTSWPAAALQDIAIEATSFTPSRGVHVGEACRGLRLRKKSTRPLRPITLGLSLLASLRRTHPGVFTVANLQAALPLVGSAAIVGLLEQGDCAGAAELATRDEKAFAAARAPALLYA